jgi:tetratricopeptide (TPR) repeat protein
VQFCLATALGYYGAQSGKNEPLIESAELYRRVLVAWTREHVPVDWAMTQNNLGNALATLGERESGTQRLEEAVAAFRAALEEYTRERVPLDWARSTGNQGVAMMLLAERKKDLAMAKTALRQIEAAFEAMRSGRHGPFAAYYEARLSEARATLGRLQAR